MSVSATARALASVCSVLSLCLGLWGCGECAASCPSTVRVNVQLPSSFDPSADFAGTACVGSTCGDFTYPGPFGDPCVGPSSATETDLVCLTDVYVEGARVSVLQYSFGGAASDGDTVYIRLTDPPGTTTIVERSATLSLQKSQVCGHHCATQTLDL